MDVIESVDQLRAEVDGLLGAVARLPLLALWRHRRVGGRLRHVVRGGRAGLLQVRAMLEDAVLTAWTGHGARGTRRRSK